MTTDCTDHVEYTVVGSPLVEISSRFLGGLGNCLSHVHPAIAPRMEADIGHAHRDDRDCKQDGDDHRDQTVHAEENGTSSWGKVNRGSAREPRPLSRATRRRSLIPGVIAWQGCCRRSRGRRVHVPVQDGDTGRPKRQSPSTTVFGRACLDRRARDCPVRAEHAAVARQRFQQSSASSAVVEPLAGIGRHPLRDPMTALRTDDYRVQRHCASGRHFARSVPISAPGPSDSPPGRRCPRRSSTAFHPGQPRPWTRRNCHQKASGRCGKRSAGRPPSIPHAPGPLA